MERKEEHSNCIDFGGRIDKQRQQKRREKRNQFRTVAEYLVERCAWCAGSLFIIYLITAIKTRDDLNSINFCLFFSLYLSLFIVDIRCVCVCVWAMLFCFRCHSKHIFNLFAYSYNWCAEKSKSQRYRIQYCIAFNYFKD